MTDIEIPLGKRTRAYRFWEIVPGVLSLAMILMPVILSVINPLVGAAFIIIYIIAWLVKAIATSYRTIEGYNTLQRSQKINWSKRLADLEDPAAAVKRRDYSGTWRAAVHERNLEQLAITVHAKKPSDIYNIIIIAAYNEGVEVIEPTLNVVLDSDYDMKRTIMVLTYEARDGAQSEEACVSLTKRYGDKFFEMHAYKHPVTEGEVRGKGGNVSYAGRLIAKRIEDLGIDPENVIVTTLDSDNRPHKGYFSYLTYEYIVHPEPRYTAFQPLTLYTNNIWDVPAAMRVVATGNTFFNIVLSLRPHLLRNFSAHSQGLASLIDMDFWSARTIVEDGHHFWRSYFRYDGHYDVVPIYVPIFQDAVLSDTYKKTLKAQFIQLRRWAYGASDVAYVATRIFRKDRTVPLFDSVIKLFRLLEGHVSWASASIILLLGAWAPLFLSPESARSIVAHELPTVASYLQRVAMIGLFITVFLTFRLLPPRPERYKRTRTFGMLAQWLLMPVTSVLYGSSAAINAQYHLLVGKYLDKFDVTEKAVVKNDE